MAGSLRPTPQIPDGYAAKLQQARASRAMEGERRVLTLLFCDVTGSTSMAEKLDPEEWTEIMNEAFQYMIAPIYTYEGTVARLMGDAVLALFGAPIAHEDDPQRAVLAGLDIVTGIEKFAAEITQIYGMDFNVRVGINTGMVVVGQVGADLALEYTAMGDAVNLAARMEQTAEPGTVQIAENTYRVIAPFFDVTPLGPLAIKGKELPVTAYRVAGIAEQPGTLRGLDGIESPLVGREDELARLRDVLTSLQSSETGHVVLITGEAGLGKSRLVAEVRRLWLESRQPSPDGWNHWDEIAAVSFEASRPYGMIKHQLRLQCNISEADTPEQAREKLAQTVSIYPTELQERLNQLYAILLGIGDDELSLQPEGEDYKRELLDAVLQSTRLRSRGLPTVMVADDLQWCDPASVDELEYLHRLMTEIPILFIGVMRPEPDAPAWAMKERIAARYPDRYSEINLRPLSEEESADLVDRLLSIEDLPDDVCDMILQRTDGNPFFIEEVIRSLLDSGALLQAENGLFWNPRHSLATVVIPGNVQALLAARIDRLEKEARHTLQLASVIGRNFYRRVLDTISETATLLDDQLRELEALRLIREAARLPEIEYTFRHALTRDATYATILRRRRRLYHRRVAEAIEMLFPDRLEEEAHRLAEHFAEALVLDKARHYYTMAGDQAVRLYANAEAVTHYERAIKIARGAEAGDQLEPLYRRLGRTYELSGRYDDALLMYAEMTALAEQQNMPRLRLLALLSEATIRSTFTAKFNARLGHQLAYEALALAQELGDAQAESKAYWNLLLLGTYTDTDATRTIEYGQKAADIARRHGLREELAYALHDLGRPYLMANRLSDGERSLEQAAQLWRELGRSNMLADNRTTLAENLSLQGDLPRAIELAMEALEISRRASSTWGQAYALVTLAPIYMEQGHVDQALAAWHEGLSAAEHANFAAPQSYARTHLALSLAHLGDLPAAFEEVRHAQSSIGVMQLPVFINLPEYGLEHLYILTGELQKARDTMPNNQGSLELILSEPVMFSLVVSTQVLLKLAEQKYAEALIEAEEALQLAEGGDLRLYYSELLLLKARALLALNRPHEAAAVIADAAAQARAIGLKKTLLPILALQLQIALQTADETTASAACEEGSQLVAYIADHISDPQLREKFRQSPPALTIRDC